MKVLITGSEGQLGRDCMGVLGVDNIVAGFDLPDLDIGDAGSVSGVVRSFRPDVIVNCAAYTNVDGAENDRASAWAANADGPGLLAACAAECSARLIHISTDYVFDGTRQLPGGYAESDKPAPRTVYGMSKAAGEAAVQENLADFAILRTAWLYGVAGRNFLKTMLRLSLKRPGQEIKVVNDQHGSPTWSYRLALQIEAVLGAGHGIYHAVGQGNCTWYELATGFLDAMGIDHRIVPCSSDEYKTAAKRPANSVLENRRLEAEGLNRMRPWLDDAREFAAMHRKRLIQEACS